MKTSLKLPLTRTTLAADAFARLRQAILDGQFAPGDRLVESHLAKTFGISRAPIREALRQLKQEGMVLYFAHRGYYVPQFNLDDLEELFLLRMALEKLAVRLAIACMTMQEFAKLENIVQRMESLHAKDANRSLATELDVSFHKHLCKMSHSKRLLNMWCNMSDQILLAILASNRSFPTYIGFAEGHRTVLEAIRSREQERAEAAIELHILTGLEQLKSTIKTASDLPQTISEEHQTET
jgi:DNA-binding GntR family transcriptional regulator